MYIEHLPKISCLVKGSLQTALPLDAFPLLMPFVSLSFWELTFKFSDNINFVVLAFLGHLPPPWEGQINYIFNLYSTFICQILCEALRIQRWPRPLSLSPPPLPTLISGSQCSGRQSSRNSATELVLCIRWWHCRDGRCLHRILIIHLSRYLPCILICVTVF